MTGALDLAAGRRRLKEIIANRSYSESGTRRLASGRASGFYFNLKTTLADPEGLNLAGELMFDLLSSRPCDVVGGLEIGAIPVLNAITLKSFQYGRPIPLFWVRKQIKEHGTGALIEGQDAEALSGKTAAIVEDVTTTGASALKAIAAARSFGAAVATAAAIVDRNEGAAENLKAEGVELLWLFRAEEFRS